MNFLEVLFMILIVLPIIPMAIFKQWRLFWVFLTFYVLFGLQEWLSVAQTGSSISQHFWQFNATHPVQAWIIVISMAVMWAGLLIHFKMGKKK